VDQTNQQYIRIRGARQHNLKNIDLDIPKNKLAVLTGVSGSGKSSLAFDTIYAEGQRRYVESLSSYARQFLGIMEKPDVDSIDGLSPAISIDQKTTSHNPRSTVGTVTEVYDYLRLLFARIGHPHCPVCGREISHLTLDQIVDQALNLIGETIKTDKKAWFLVFSPMVSDRKGEFSQLFENLKAKGYKQVRIDGYIYDLSEEIVLLKTNKHTIEAVIDRIVATNIKGEAFKSELRGRLADSIQQALNLSEGLVVFGQVLDKEFTLPPNPKNFRDHLFSEKFSCPVDNISLPEIEPRIFSFNSPQGACPSCTGLGKILKVEPDLIFSPELTINEGGILPFANMLENDSWYGRTILAVCEENKINPRVPIKDLTEAEKKILLFGTGTKEYKVEGKNRFGKDTLIWQRYEGVANNLERRYAETESDWARDEIKKYMRERVCPDCLGARLKKEVLSITIDNLSIADVTGFSVTKMVDWVNTLDKVMNSRESEIGELIIKEINGRIQFLLNVGLEYLTLNRVAGSLSGGEAQRIRLASQIGSGLTGVLYVLDEPTIGLHPRDDDKLISTLKKLRDLGNSVVVVEHDASMMLASDYIVDFGPGAGKLGGQVIAQGTPKEIMESPKSITGQYLSGKKVISLSSTDYSNQKAVDLGLSAVDKSIKIFGANQFSLKNLDVEFPLGKLVSITGVSGSGKSTLLVETLYPALQKELNPLYRGDATGYKKIEGLKNSEGVPIIDKAILIDQSPIGRTPRSNPSTYTGMFDIIRDVFAATRDSKTAGYKKGRFSFNVRGGRCEACEGQGQIKIEMQFMSDLWVTCEVCKGKRYNAQTLEVLYRGKNIAEVLDMTITDALEFFHTHPQILSKLETLSWVGLGYMQLGQAATTLSGGEAQRVKLASELARKATGKTIYILDEPTTGLHFADVEKLLKVLRLLVQKGNSVFVIEHNLDVIKNSDYVIDLGPEGGDGGGKIVAMGTPTDIKNNKSSVTGAYL